MDFKEHFHGVVQAPHTTPTARSCAYLKNDSGFRSLQMHQSLMLCTIIQMVLQSKTVGFVVTSLDKTSSIMFLKPLAVPQPAPAD